MKIYCSGSISGDINYRRFYLEIINYVTELKHIAFSQLNENLNTQNNITDNEIYLRDINWIENSALLIAEVSGSSTGVGYEISYSLFQKKIPVLALANKNVKRVTAMLTGCDEKLLTLKFYSDVNELKQIVNDFIFDKSKD